MHRNLITRFLYYFQFHWLFWFLVFEALYRWWEPGLPYDIRLNLVLGALLGILVTILLHGVRILSGGQNKK
ncbi:MAG: hypothetical protein ACKO1U_00960 [Bacteroidota bacterium]